MVKWKTIFNKVLGPKKEEVYTPQRESIDRRHDALQRQISYYEKKRDIPRMQEKVKLLEREVFGSGGMGHTGILNARNYFKASNDLRDNILQAPNQFGRDPNGSILSVPNHFKSDPNGSILSGRSQQQRGVIPIKQQPKTEQMNFGQRMQALKKAKRLKR